MNELIFQCFSFGGKRRRRCNTLCCVLLPLRSAIPIFEVFWSEEEEKTIEYRFFNDVTKTRSM
ncbi:MAG: hypothetical protein IJF69_01350, partial [Clostridia bacterium]|nr:hypothetical protein [Clostridia bacterium]